MAADVASVPFLANRTRSAQDTSDHQALGDLRFDRMGERQRHAIAKLANDRLVDLLVAVAEGHRAEEQTRSTYSLPSISQV